MLTAKWSELYAYNMALIKAAIENAAYSGTILLRADISLTDEIALTKAVTIIGGAHGLLAYSAKLTMENTTLELRCRNGEKTAAALSTWAVCLSL